MKRSSSGPAMVHVVSNSWDYEMLGCAERQCWSVNRAMRQRIPILVFRKLFGVKSYLNMPERTQKKQTLHVQITNSMNERKFSKWK